MKITRGNYEIYFVDYFDGKLGPVELAELMHFLSRNPDLEEEFSEFQPINLIVVNDEYSDKNTLKKNFHDIKKITDNNFDELCIAALEGDLDEFTKEHLQYYIKTNPAKKREFDSYKNTYLTPERSIIFQAKHKLKKKQTYILTFSRIINYGSIAATVILAVLFFVLSKNKPQERQFTEQKKTTTFLADPQPMHTAEINVENKARKTKSVKRAKELHKEYTLDLQTTEPDTFKLTRESLPVESLNLIKPIEIDKVAVNKNLSTPLENFQADIKKTSNNSNPEKNKKSLNPLKKSIENLNHAISNENINLWILAEASIKSFNYLTESDMELEKKTNENGNVVEFELKSESFSFSTSRKK